MGKLFILKERNEELKEITRTKEHGAMNLSLPLCLIATDNKDKTTLKFCKYRRKYIPVDESTTN